MENVEGMQMKYFVLKTEDIKQHLTREQKLQLHYIENTIDEGRIIAGKEPISENVYLVINSDEPYADEVIEILKRNGHWGEV